MIKSFYETKHARYTNTEQKDLLGKLLVEIVSTWKIYLRVEIQEWKTRSGKLGVENQEWKTSSGKLAVENYK